MLNPAFPIFSMVASCRLPLGRPKRKRCFWLIDCRARRDVLPSLRWEGDLFLEDQGHLGSMVARRVMGNYGSSGNNGKHEPERLLPPRGDYQTLLSFQKAEVIYDITFRFAHKFLAKGDRTIDQMIQSARFGKKNILEGSKAATTSKETEIKLTNV